MLVDYVLILANYANYTKTWIFIWQHGFYFFCLIGRQHMVNVMYCGCFTKAETLVSLGLWPGSPSNTSTAFDINFMDLCRSFMLESHISLKSFCESVALLKQTSAIYSDQVSWILFVRFHVIDIDFNNHVFCKYPLFEGPLKINKMLKKSLL